MIKNLPRAEMTITRHLGEHSLTPDHPSHPDPSMLLWYQYTVVRIKEIRNNLKKNSPISQTTPTRRLGEIS